MAGARKADCDACTLKSLCCPKAPARKVTRSIHEAARDVAREIAKTDAYWTSMRQRKKVEMLFAHLQAFEKDQGHCRVPARYVNSSGYRLGQWVRVQRYREDHMPVEQEARLDALGFTWDPLTADWERGFSHLEAFAKKHGHCRVHQIINPMTDIL